MKSWKKNLMCKETDNTAMKGLNTKQEHLILLPLLLTYEVKTWPKMAISILIG